MGMCHVIGGGLAGLSAALRLAEAGRRVRLYEQAPQAGGRCRSFYDATLDRTIDNGSHLALSGNHALVDYARRIGAGAALVEQTPAAFPFLDLRNGDSWILRPGGLWLFDRQRRVPNSRPWHYLAALRAVLADAGQSVDDVLPPDGPLHERLWRPLAVSALNAPTARASARLFGAVMRETLLRGEAACRPLLAPQGLGAAFVDPALRRLAGLGVELRLGARVDALRLVGTRATGLSVDGTMIDVAAGDSVILAAPAWVAERLMPGLTAPPPGPTIVNAHFRLDHTVNLPGGLPFLGLVGGTAEWLFARGDVVAVTVSAADALAQETTESIAATLWRDVAAALRLDGPSRPCRVVKERRATPDQAPDSVLRRPPTQTRWDNLCLAGDWTDTGLPASLEAAVRSGDRAARCVLSAC